MRSLPHSKTPKIKTPIIKTVAATLALALAGTAAGAQSSCGPRDIVLARLAEKFGESRQSIGLAPNNQLIEVFASTDTGSWTITVTRPGGITCLVASGQAFETLAEAVPTPEKDA